MNQEWREYAISIKEQIEKINKLWVIYMCTFVMLGILAMWGFFINKIAFLIIVISYILLFIYNQKDKDIYAKKIFFIGIFIFYLALEMSFIFGIIDLFRNCFFIMLPVCVSFYEIKVLMDIKQKKYSSKKTKISNTVYAFLTLISGTAIGLRIGKLAGRTLEESSLFFMLSAIVVSLLFICAIMYLQRYVVYKLLRLKNG